MTVLALVRELVRRCACCRRPLSRKKRRHARTCSKACRQKLSRRAKASCEATTARRRSTPVLSAVARARAGLDAPDITREKRLVHLVQVGAAGVRIA